MTVAVCLGPTATPQEWRWGAGRGAARRGLTADCTEKFQAVPDCEELTSETVSLGALQMVCHGEDGVGQEAE